MHALLMFPVLIVLALAAPMTAASNEGRVGADFLPPAIADDIRSIIKINDPSWVVREVGSFATSIGVPSAFAQGALAEFLFGAADLTGIDTLRPAVMAWRNPDEPAPLIAIIPVRNRDQFLRTFGQVFRLDRLLLRVGERDGTVVYTRTTPNFIEEYRVLFLDGYAYLARNVSECRALAEKGLPPIRDEPAPVQIITAGRAVGDLLVEPLLAGVFSRQLLGLSPDRSIASWRDVIANAGGLHNLAKQFSQVHAELGPLPDGRVGMRVEVATVADSALAIWAGRQSNRSSRLLPMVQRAGDIVQVHGAIRWNGEMESIGRQVADHLLHDEDKEAIRQRLTPELESHLRTYFRMQDQNDGFAMAKSLRAVVDDPTQGWFRVFRVDRQVQTQPRAADYLTVLRSMDQIFTPDRVGDFGAHAGLVSYQGKIEDLIRYQTIADRNRLVSVQAFTDLDQQNESEAMIKAVATVPNPAGTAGIAVMRFDVAEYCRYLAVAHRRPAPIETVEPIEIALMADGRQGLVIETAIRPLETSRMLGQVGVLSTFRWQSRADAPLNAFELGMDTTGLFGSTAGDGTGAKK